MAVPGQPKPGNTGKPIILVVDENPTAGQLLGEVLHGNQWEIRTACSYGEALEKLATQPPLLTIINLRTTSLELVEEIRRSSFTGEVILLTAADSQDLFPQAGALGVKYWVSKPFDLEELQALVEGAMRELVRRSDFIP
jgi:DNA-binding response OmpR family regulator